MIEDGADLDRLSPQRGSRIARVSARGSAEPRLGAKLAPASACILSLHQSDVCGRYVHAARQNLWRIHADLEEMVYRVSQNVVQYVENHCEPIARTLGGPEVPSRAPSITIAEPCY